MSTQNNLPPRGQILSKASTATLQSRHELYGDPYTDMSCAAQFEAIYFGHAKGKYSPAHDEAMRRVFIKLARIACGAPGHEDSYVDLAAYIAIAFEVQQVADQLVGDIYKQVMESNAKAASCPAATTAPERVDGRGMLNPFRKPRGIAGGVEE